jgi:hypothetical protein
MRALAVVVGIILMVAAARGTHRELGDLLSQQLSPKYGFLPWLLAIGFVASLQRISAIAPVAKALLGLLILVLLLNASQSVNLVDAARVQLGLGVVK